MTRAGHTEASTDLARLAGLEPAGVIVEILQEDGSMARRPELEMFAQKHGLKIGTVADLIAYRLSQEQTITQTASCELPTAYGIFKLNTYQSIYKPSRLHFALSKGDIDPETPTFVRVHVQNALSDLFHAQLPDRTYTLQDALQHLANEPSGVVVVLDAGEDYQAIEQRIHALAQRHHDKPRADEPHLRTYGIGAQILVAEGVRKMRLLSSPYKFTSLSGYHLEVSEYVSL